MDDALDRLRQLPRAGLVQGKTPLQPLRRLSREVGAEIWLKRDDAGPPALAGNKVRKFDLVLGEGLRNGADLLITAGAAQSNSARTGAAAAAILGMDCRLLLSGPAPTSPTGNLVIDALVGARVDFLGDVSWRQLEQAVEEAGRAAEADGRTPVTAPVGCSSPLGALGFALAYLELRRQCERAGLRPAAIVHASSSLGTHAGLLVGRALAGDSTPIIGIDVAAMAADLEHAADDLAARAGDLIGLDIPQPGAHLIADFLGPGYGEPDARTAHAISAFARSEAVLLDPVYSGKGAAGALAVAGRSDGPIVFWHTGGYHALFDPAHFAALAAVAPERQSTGDEV